MPEQNDEKYYEHDDEDSYFFMYPKISKNMYIRSAMKNLLSFSGYGPALLDVILPRTCVVCGGRLNLHEKHICISCLADLPRTGFSSVPRNQMSDRFNALLKDDPVPYSNGTSLFFYRSGYKDITRRLKYHADLGAGRYFAAMLAREMEASEIYSDVDGVIPVPLHWSRKWSRGYNQAEIIAWELAGALGAKLMTGVLVRDRRTGTQTRLSLEKKTANVSGAFSLRKGADMSGYSHLLLVDDVFTTGATLRSCYEAIRGSTLNSVKISIATLAYVGY